MSKDKLDPSYTYMTLTANDIQKALAKYVYEKLGWKGGIKMDMVRFDLNNDSATVGIKLSSTEEE